MALVNLHVSGGGGALSPRRFSVHEAVSSLFTVSVWARSENDSIPFEPVVGRPASLRLESGYAHIGSGGSRLWTGICSHFEQVKAVTPQAGQKPLHTYYVRIVPALWLLTHRRNHRIFQHQSIPEIVEKILKEWKLEADWKIDQGKYPKLEYKVQYGESDYVFLSRLLEEAGIAFTFPDPQAGGAKLTFGDALQANEPRAPLLFTDNPNQQAEKELIRNVRLAQDVRPGAFTMRDYDFRRPSFELFGDAPRAEGPEGGYEQYHYEPGGFLVEGSKGGDTPAADDKGVARYEQGYGKAKAERMLAAERMGRKSVAFEANVMDVFPGAVFTMLGHPNAALSDGKRLLVTEFSIDGTPDGEWSMGGRAVFADVPFRQPRRTSKPKAFSVQSATVVGPKGQEIHTDEFGRVRVQFPWDREGKSDDGSSCWIRVSQGWAGTSYGMIVLPRIGQEVLVGFLEGDPEQPILVGRAYNTTEPVPYKLPENKTISAWKSDSSPGSDGFNEIKYEDKTGDELFYEQAEKNRRMLVKNNETITVLRHREKSVGANETDTTGVNRFEVTGINRSETTGANRMTAIGGTRRKLIKKDETERTEGDRWLRVGKDEDLKLKKKRRELIEGDSHLIVKGNRSEAIDNNQSMMVIESRHEKVEGRYALETGKELYLRSAEVFVGEAGRDLTIAVKGGGGGGPKNAPAFVSDGAKAIVESDSYKSSPDDVKNQINSKSFTEDEKKEVEEVLGKYAPLMTCKDQPLKNIGRTDKAITNTSSGAIAETSTMGEWFDDSGTLVLTDAASSGSDFKDPSKQFRGTAAHEIAHALFNNFDPRTCKKYDNYLDNPLMKEYMKEAGWDSTGSVLTPASGEQAPTDYAEQNPQEDLSESTMFYLYEPETLKEKSPSRYKFLQELFASMAPGGFIRIDATGVTIMGATVYINEGGKKAGKGKAPKTEDPEAPEGAVSGAETDE